MSYLQWHGENESLEIGPFLLQSPLVYSTDTLDCDERSAIFRTKHLKRPSSDSSWRSHAYQFMYGYRSMDATTRWQYLEWLHNGRPRAGSLAFLPLYLQGLERRVITDQADLLLIWNELWRIYPAQEDEWHPVRMRVEKFLWFLLPQIGDMATNKQVATLARTTRQISQWDPEPKSQLSLLLHWSTQKFGHLPEWVAFYCALILPEASRTVVLERAEWEMLQLFALEWKRRGEQETSISLPDKALRRYEYRPQNKTLKATSATWKDPLKSTKQWKKLSHELVSLFNHCQTELRPFGLLLGRDGITRENRLAWEALPAALQQGEHPSRAKLHQLGGDLLETTGYATTTLEAVARALELGERPALSPQLSRGIAQSLQYCGLGVEPDARLSGKSYRWDDALMIFRASPEKLGTADEAAALRYQSHAAFIRCALYVAQAAGEVQQETLSLIAQRLFETFELQPMEKRRAKALANHLVRQNIALTGHKWPTEAMEKLSEKLPPLLLEIVGRNGQVNKAEEAALAVVWKRLGQEKRKLAQKLDDLSLRGVVFVGNAVAGRPGERLPPPPIGASPTVAFELDHAVIGALLEDTAHVHRALHEAMGGEEEEGSVSLEEPDAPPVSEEVPEAVVYAGLPPQLGAFLTTLLQQPQWGLAAAQELARSHDTMLAGAVEKINDWAFEELGEQLIYDDGDVLSVEQGIVEA